MSSRVLWDADNNGVLAQAPPFVAVTWRRQRRVEETSSGSGIQDSCCRWPQKGPRFPKDTAGVGATHKAVTTLRQHNQSVVGGV